MGFNSDFVAEVGDSINIFFLIISLMIVFLSFFLCYICVVIIRICL